MAYSIDVNKISPQAQKIIANFATTSGTESMERVIEDLAFSIFELMHLIDVSRDPQIYPQDAIKVMLTVKTVIERFNRFPDSTK